MTKYVYFFGGSKAEGNGKMKDLLGGKGANLAEMCQHRPARAGRLHPHHRGLHLLLRPRQDYPAGAEGRGRRRPAARPKRSWAPSSATPRIRCSSPAAPAPASRMPGMMDTVLNIGLNEATLRGLIDKTGNERFAWDSYRRFVQMYGDVVLDLKPQIKTEIDPFEQIMDELKHERGVKLDTELTVDDLKELVKRFKKAVKEKKGKDFPDDPHGADVGRHRRRVRLVDERPRHRLSPAVRLSRTTGARPPTSARWSSATWATTPAPASPSRATRPPAKRSSTANTSSTPRAKTWSPASARRRRSPSWKRTCREVYKQLDEIREQAGKALPRRAGHRVHHPEGQALDAADPQRQAHRLRRASASPWTWSTRA